MGIFIFFVLIVAMAGYWFYSTRKNNQPQKTATREIKGSEDVGKVTREFVDPEDYEDIEECKHDGFYRSKELVEQGRFEEGLEQLQVVYKAKIQQGGVWNRAQRDICSLKRYFVDRPIKAMDILDPKDLTQYGRENIDRVLLKLNQILENYKDKETKLIEELLECRTVNVSHSKLDKYFCKPVKEQITEALGRNWAQKAENMVREEDGVPKVGEGWVNEAKLKNLVANLLEPLGYEVIHRASPDWIGNQHLDIYIPGLELAIEYMGKQHYEPVEFFGGEERYRETKKRDKVKKMKCTKNDVSLIRYKYNEPITVNHTARRICEKTELKTKDMDPDVEVLDDDELPSYNK